MAISHHESRGATPQPSTTITIVSASEALRRLLLTLLDNPSSVTLSRRGKSHVRIAATRHVHGQRRVDTLVGTPTEMSPLVTYLAAWCYVVLKHDDDCDMRFIPTATELGVDLQSISTFVQRYVPPTPHRATRRKAAAWAAIANACSDRPELGQVNRLTPDTLVDVLMLVLDRRMTFAEAVELAHATRPDSDAST